MLTCSWDLDAAAVNPELALLSWLVPLSLARDVSVFTSVFALPDEKLIVAASRDRVLAFRCCATVETSEELANAEEFLKGDLDTMKRIQK